MAHIRQKGALGIDAGLARVGVAKASADRKFSFEVASIERRSLNGPHSIVPMLCRALEIDESDLVRQFEVIYVGYPLNLDGRQTISTQQAIDLALKIELETGIEVRLVDERLSTKSASTLMQAVGKSTKDQRKKIDAIAALLILEQAVNLEGVNQQFAGLRISEVSQHD